MMGLYLPRRRLLFKKVFLLYRQKMDTLGAEEGSNT